MPGNIILFLFTICITIDVSYSSNGDGLPFYRDCLTGCDAAECGSKARLDSFYTKQPWWMYLIGWTCYEECKYKCMWKTVEVYQSEVLKFHGKWPFLRVMGAQEIVSSIASIMNLIPHVIMMKKYRQTFNKLYPMFYEWQLYALMNINAWFWSTLFHIKDTPFTERMDYFCAFSLILANLYFYVVRMTQGRTALHLVVGALAAAFLLYHVHYMTYVHFDYGYNMKVGVTIGVSTLIGWALWYLKVRRKQPYALNVFICSFSTSLLLSLEILDFPPILWLFDAHAIWHLSTAPLSYFWYRFVFSDLHYMKRRKTHFA